jgi:hypothetical protein
LNLSFLSKISGKYLAEIPRGRILGKNTQDLAEKDFVSEIANPSLIFTKFLRRKIKKEVIKEEKGRN